MEDRGEVHSSPFASRVESKTEAPFDDSSLGYPRYSPTKVVRPQLNTCYLSINRYLFLPFTLPSKRKYKISLPLHEKLVAGLPDTKAQSTHGWPIKSCGAA
jgi:hypothetical protein